MLGGDVVAPLHERPDRGGRGVEDRDAVLRDDLPPAALVRGVGSAFVHHLRRAVGERSVDHVGVAGHPADVGGAPVDVVVLEVEDRPVRVGRAGEVAAGRVQDALGGAGRAGGVHDVERVLGVVHRRVVLGRRGVHDVVPPHVAGVVPRDVLTGAADDDDVLDAALPATGGDLGHGLVHGRLQRARCTAAVAAVGGEDDLRPAVDHARGERVGGEAAEDHGVRGTEAGAGQHRDHDLGDHRHVDRDPVALLHAELGERVGGAADLVHQVGVGDVAGVVLGLADPVEGDLVAVAGVDVAVHAVDGRVEGATHEPLRERRVGPVEDLVPPLAPVEAFGGLAPEGLPVGGGPVVGLLLDVGVGSEVGRRLEAALLGAEVLEGLVGHDISCGSVRRQSVLKLLGRRDCDHPSFRQVQRRVER
ncbi:acetyl-CoA synthetase [Nocardioides sp. CF8]|nr:acetyl-CoA synthetase [Nocardioides sp. CF8]